MSELLKKYPVPAAGLILGVAALGNYIQYYGDLYRNILGVISAILSILMIAKVFKYPKGVKESLDNPVVGSVFPTLSMAMMVLSTYLKPYTAVMGYMMWAIGFLLHVILIAWFTKKFVANFNIKKVFPSWFIVYVGIAVASVTGPVYNMAALSKVAFWFGFVSYLILLPIIIYRVVRVKELPEQTLPTLVIFSAPASLLLAGYINSFESKIMIIFWFLMVLSVIMYIVVLAMLPKLLRLQFYPSYSAFTFPLVISGIAIRLASGFLIKSGQAVFMLGYLINLQVVIGVAVPLYVLIRYIVFLLPDNRERVDFKIESK